MEVPLPRPKILVVEDERDVAKVIAINLKLEGMEVVEVHDGPSALEKVGEVMPDCVVLDVMLPKVSGWDILNFIKTNPETSDIPVVMVTAKVEERDQLRGLGAGAVKYITKPFSPMTLTETIKSVLKPQAAEEVARERKETIERLQLSTIHKISDILISAPVMDELLEGVSDKMMALFDLPACAMILSDDEPDAYVFKRSAQPGKSRGIMRLSLSRQVDTLLHQAFSTNRRAARASDVESFVPAELFPGMDDIGDPYVLPLFERNNYFGAIVIVYKPDMTMSLDEQDLLETIANQVAAAVARARLHENIREDEIVHRRLLHQTITAQESERRRLASEIHDSVVQSLVGVSYRLQALEKKLPADADGAFAADIKLLEEQLSENIRELRGLLLGLRPPMLDDMGVFTALSTHLKSFGMKNSIQTTLQLPDELPALSRDAQINLFRIVQEALNNVEKHADATHVTIEFEVTPQKLFVAVRDDGRGFQPTKGRGKQRNLGIASMRERTELLGGTLKIKSEPGRGTMITLDVPLRAILEG